MVKFSFAQEKVIFDCLAARKSHLMDQIFQLAKEGPVDQGRLNQVDTLGAMMDKILKDVNRRAARKMKKTKKLPKKGGKINKNVPAKIVTISDTHIQIKVKK